MRWDFQGESAVIDTPLQGESAVIDAPIQGELAVIDTPLQGELAIIDAPLQGELAGIDAPLQGESAGIDAPCFFEKKHQGLFRVTPCATRAKSFLLRKRNCSAEKKPALQGRVMFV
ncbi:MAG: hypothetical protein CAK90_02720 [Spartobacteria bacterium AMD-G4]|nr:MAG: hypothetical protein CAK90_02720 [Spartobacteria bacterium AMD-G4]